MDSKLTRMVNVLVSFTLFLPLITFFLAILIILRKKKKKKREILELNGGNLLQEVIATSNGVENPINIRFFSAFQLRRAKEDFRKGFLLAKKLSETNNAYVYSGGILEGRLILIKEYSFADYNPFRNITITAMMTNHNNVLKLLGCCLESRVPALLYEYNNEALLRPRGGSRKFLRNRGVFEEILDLFIQGNNENGCYVNFLPWMSRLKIAKEIADVVRYLHTAFPRPIIHRDIRIENFFLDEGEVAKLSDFSHCILIPEGQSHVEEEVTEELCGPFHEKTSIITEKTDVYSFGMLLLVLLTGQTAPSFRRSNGYEDLSICVKELVNENRNDVVDPTIIRDVSGNGQEKHLQSQLQAFGKLALRCIDSKPENRPTMIEVSEELLRIETQDS